jgi:hypothetical protein
LWFSLTGLIRWGGPLAVGLLRNVPNRGRSGSRRAVLAR